MRATLLKITPWATPESAHVASWAARPGRTSAQPRFSLHRKSWHGERPPPNPPVRARMRQLTYRASRSSTYCLNVSPALRSRLQPPASALVHPSPPCYLSAAGYLTPPPSSRSGAGAGRVDGDGCHWLRLALTRVAQPHHIDNMSYKMGSVPGQPSCAAIL